MKLLALSLKKKNQCLYGFRTFREDILLYTARKSGKHWESRWTLGCRAGIDWITSNWVTLMRISNAEYTHSGKAGAIFITRGDTLKRGHCAPWALPKPCWDLGPGSRAGVGSLVTLTWSSSLLRWVISLPLIVLFSRMKVKYNKSHWVIRRNLNDHAWSP